MLPTPNRPPRLYGWVVALFLALSVIFVLMAVTSRDRQGSTWTENAVSSFLYPLQSAVSWVSSQVRGVGAGVVEMFQLREENERLRAAAGGLPALASELVAVRRENDRLRQELGLRPLIPQPLVSAEVIGRDPRAWFDTVVINRGARDGLLENQAVINHEGFVGKVQRVTPMTATVKLLIDRSFAVSAQNALTDEVGGLEGRGQDGVIMLFTHNRDPRVAVGDPIVTSGLGGVIPKGLFIGSVSAVGTLNQGLIRYAELRTAVNFQKLDIVQVVITQPEAGLGVDNP